MVEKEKYLEKMEAKKKAKKLVQTFKKNISGWDHYHDVDDSVRQLEKAQESAINCVNEIMKEITPEDAGSYCSPFTKIRLDYWAEVKREINLIAKTCT